MRDVAERAGVSSMTVSYVINGRKVSEKNRAAVLAAIEALGYAPNPVARALASASAVRIGLLYQEYEGRTHGYLGELLVGAVRASTDLGVQLVIHRCETDPHAASSSIRNLIRRGVNGVLLPAQFAHVLEGSTEFATLGMPAIVLAPGGATVSMPSIGIDDFEAAAAITKLLIAQDHRRIGFLHGLAIHPASRTRYLGFISALAEAGIRHDAELVARGNFVFKDALPAAAELLDREDPPTAIFAANDEMAAALVSVAHRRGLRIPADLAIAGFDDAPIATQIWPTLTTVRQPLAEMAARGVEYLLGALNKGEKSRPPEHIEVPFQIIERESTGPRLAL